MHKGAFRAFMDENKVSEIVKYMLQGVCECGGEVKLRKRKKPTRHQVLELPEIKPIITEYQQFKGKCVCCFKRSTASLPGRVARRNFPPSALTEPYVTVSSSHTALIVQS